MQVRVYAFAGARELIEASERRLDLPDGARICDAWEALQARYPALAPHLASMRFACNGRLADRESTLLEGDELAILPPVGGG